MREKLIDRIRELVEGIVQAGYTPPAWTWIAQRTITDDQIIAFGKRLRVLHDTCLLWRQIANLGYNVDSNPMLDNATQEELESYMVVQQEYLDWCQRHKAAIDTLRAAWRAERDIGVLNPTSELTLNLFEMSIEDIRALITTVENRTLQAQEVTA